jgi:Zn-dependent protease with chaperone function
MSSVDALLLDGASALERRVTLGWDEDALSLREADGRQDIIGWNRLYHAATEPEAVMIGHHDRPGWRLHVRRDSPAELFALLPKTQKYGGWIDRIGIWKAAVGFTAVSAAVLAAVFTAPIWIAPLVPESWERQIGEAMVGDFDRFACHTPEADAAVAALVKRLDPGKHPVDVYIANIPIPNAVALPGSKILLFDGFIAQAESPDEVAGVLGHEIGHVRERHVMQALLREFGLSILLSGANTVGNTLAGMAGMSYSREAESAADAYSRKRLAAANISPAGAAAFFERMRKMDPLGENETLGYLASHPASSARARAFTTAVEKGHDYDEALTPAQFKALSDACQRDPDVEDFEFF